MKQVELLDLTLEALYEHKSHEGDIVSLLRDKDIFIDMTAAVRVGRRLADAGYVKFTATGNSAYAVITSQGMEFVEGDSFTDNGHSIINNTYINNSPHANLVNHSSHVSIHQESVRQIDQLLAQIKGEINDSQEIGANGRLEILNCLMEIKQGVTAGLKPKYAVKSLIEMSSNLSTVAGLGLQLMNLLK